MCNEKYRWNPTRKQPRILSDSCNMFLCRHFAKRNIEGLKEKREGQKDNAIFNYTNFLSFFS